MSAAIDLETPASLDRRAPGLALAATSVATIVALGVLRITDGPSLPQTILQVLLVVAFGLLAIINVRSAVAITLVEIACLGASGLWTLYPAGISGRQVLHAIVLLRLLIALGNHWRTIGRFDLGRYGAHAFVLAIVIPLVWMPVGFLNDNAARDVFGDGNAHLFFAFSLAVIALIWTGSGPWLRRWLFIACIANGIVTGLLIAISVTGFVDLYRELRPVLLHDLVMGGAVGYMPNGAYRLYLGSGLYLQIGAALTTWYLLRQPREWWLWAIYALFALDITATYTRGFWLGAAVAVGMVLVLGTRDLWRPLVVLGGTAAIFAVSSGVGAAFDFSLPAYVLDRSASALSIDSGGGGSSISGEDPQVPPQGHVGGSGEDVGGQFSNQVRMTQARVLLGHIAERPVFGHGFGTIADDYPYGHIYSYELTYLDLAYKTGIVGVIAFLSFPLRLLADALRIRFDVLQAPRRPSGVSRHEMAVVIAIVGSVLVASATNPYLLAAFGLMPILTTIAWLQPADE